MKIRLENGRPTLVLSRRNLLALLAKLDGHPPMSTCTIMGGGEAPGVHVHAEEDHIHYARRKAGPMHPSTEEQIKKEYLL